MLHYYSGYSHILRYLRSAILYQCLTTNNLMTTANYPYLNTVQFSLSNMCLPFPLVSLLTEQNYQRHEVKKLRPITHECVPLDTCGHLPVTWQRWRSQHSTRRSQKLQKLHANFMALCFIEPELLTIEVSHYWNGIFYLFLCSCDLDLDQMTFIYKPGPKFTDNVLRFIIRYVLRLSWDKSYDVIR